MATRARPSKRAYQQAMGLAKQHGPQFVAANGAQPKERYANLLQLMFAQHQVANSFELVNPTTQVLMVTSHADESVCAFIVPIGNVEKVLREIGETRGVTEAAQLVKRAPRDGNRWVVVHDSEEKGVFVTQMRLQPMVDGGVA